MNNWPKPSDENMMTRILCMNEQINRYKMIRNRRK